MQSKGIIGIAAIYIIMYLISLGYGSFLIGDANKKLKGVKELEGLTSVLEKKNSTDNSTLTLNEIANGLQSFSGVKLKSRSSIERVDWNNIKASLNSNFKEGIDTIKSTTKKLGIVEDVKKNIGIILLIKSLAEMGTSVILSLLVFNIEREKLFKVWTGLRVVLLLYQIGWYFYLFLQDDFTVDDPYTLATAVILGLLDGPMTLLFAYFINKDLKNQVMGGQGQGVQQLQQQGQQRLGQVTQSKPGQIKQQLQQKVSQNVQQNVQQQIQQNVPQQLQGLNINTAAISAQVPQQLQGHLNPAAITAQVPQQLQGHLNPAAISAQVPQLPQQLQNIVPKS